MSCVEYGDGQFLEEEIPCATGLSCRNSTGQCVSTGNYECSLNSTITLPWCLGIGMFPNPYNCNEYYMCSTSSGPATPEKCSANYAFDSSTGRCSKKLESGSRCASDIPICTTAGQTGNIASFPNLFYRCTQKTIEGVGWLVPEIYPCPNNYYFNGAQCVNPTPNVITSSGNCIAKGVFYFPGDCEKYRECATIGVLPAVKTFTSPNRFDPVLGKCVRYECSKHYFN